MTLEKYNILSSYFVNLLIDDYLFKLDSLIKHFVKTTNISRLIDLAVRMSSSQTQALSDPGPGVSYEHIAFRKTYLADSGDISHFGIEEGTGAEC